MRTLIMSLLLVLIAGWGCTQQNNASSSLIEFPVSNAWYSSGESQLKQALLKQTNNQRGSAKNIVLMIGDGMSLSTVTAARIYAGQLQGKAGEEHQLSFELFPWTGFAKTYNTNQQTPDSAGTMTAMVSGIKTKAGLIGIDERAERSNCSSSQGAEVATLLEIAEDMGKATGLATNTRITHATPAATFAKSPEREWESDNNLSAEALAEGCEDIAVQLIEFGYGDGIDVILGGGRRHFLPESLVGIEGRKGRRADNRNLLEEWQQRYPEGRLVQNSAEFSQLREDTSEPVLGLFNSSHMRYAPDRKNDEQGEPNLAQMTSLAIKKLQQEHKGFFLMVEGGRIDHAHHAGNAKVALMETLEFAEAVAAVDQLTDDEDTLIIVTADHSHTLVAGGYATRGNPILGKVVTNDGRGNAKKEVARDLEGNPYTTLSYLNGPGYAEMGSASTNPDRRYREAAVSGKQTLEGVDTEDVGYHQEAMVPLEDETHSVVDVPVYAKGPGAHLLSGTIEQHVIFHVMRHAGGY